MFILFFQKFQFVKESIDNPIEFKDFTQKPSKSILSTNNKMTLVNDKVRVPVMKTSFATPKIPAYLSSVAEIDPPNVSILLESLKLEKLKVQEKYNSLVKENYEITRRRGY